MAANSPATERRGKAKKLPRQEPDPMLKRETLQLVRAYYKIENEDVRKRLVAMIAVLGAAGA